MNKLKENLYPQDQRIETAVLGALMIEKNALPRVLGILSENVFYATGHQLIFRAICQLHDRSEGIDILTVTNRLLEMGKLEEAGGPFYITQISSQVASSAHLEQHAKILYDLFIRREMIMLFTRQLGRAADMTRDMYDVLTESMERLNKLEHGCDTGTMRDLPTLIESTLHQAHHRMQNNKDGLTGIPTGLNELDKLTAGWQASHLIVIGARPASGKTSLTTYMAWVAALAGYKVAYFSIEMEGERLADKWIVGETGISADNWRRGTVTGEEDKVVAASLPKLMAPVIHVDDNPVMSMEYIKSKCRTLKLKDACDIAFIDYLQLAEIKGDKSNTMAVNIGEMAAKAKAMAKELDIPVILISQLNRESEKRDNKRPIMADLRESGGIEQVADLVALIHNPSKAGLAKEEKSGYPVEGLGVLIIEKNRYGATGDIYFGYNESMTRFGDYEPSKEWMERNAKPLTAKELRSRGPRESRGPRGGAADFPCGG